MTKVDALKPSDELNAILEKFEHAKQISDLGDAVTGLLKAKLVSDARSDVRFVHGLERCIALASSAEEGEIRLRALAMAFRLGATVKPVMLLLRRMAAPAWEAELPPPSLLIDSDDRRYIAVAIEEVEAPWVLDYAARAIAEEPKAEIARKAFAKRLIGSEPLASSLLKLASSLSMVKFGTESPETAAARRMKWVIQSIRPFVVATSMLPGDDLGLALRKFFLSPFTNTGAMKYGKDADQLASEACGLVHDILRTQLTVVADASIYNSLSVCRSWTSQELWPRFVRKDPAAGRVIATLEEALILLGKQGTGDQALLDSLLLLTGRREDAQARAKRLSEANSGLPSNVRQWLSRFGGNAPIVNPHLAEMSEASSDAIVAELLVESLAAHAVSARSQNVLQSQLEKLEIAIGRLAAARRLRTKLAPGEVIDYSPHAHELVGGHVIGVAKVRVLQPLVERVSSSYISQVILKAVVERVQQGDDPQ